MFEASSLERQSLTLHHKLHVAGGKQIEALAVERLFSSTVMRRPFVNPLAAGPDPNHFGRRISAELVCNFPSSSCHFDLSTSQAVQYIRDYLHVFQHRANLADGQWIYFRREDEFSLFVISYFLNICCSKTKTVLFILYCKLQRH